MNRTLVFHVHIVIPFTKQRRESIVITQDKDEAERCIICSALSLYTKKTPIGKRQYYIAGQGQLCEHCGTDPKLKSALFVESEES